MFSPDFERNTLRVLRGERPERATLFELFISTDQIARLAGCEQKEEGALATILLRAKGMQNLGCDFATCYASDQRFIPHSAKKKLTVSLNNNAFITDRESFEKFQWPDMRISNRDAILEAKQYMPSGMKLIVLAPGGILENAIDLVGYDDLCFMIYDEPELAKCIFDQIGARLVDYYQAVADLDNVGAFCINDDWGFNTQTLLGPSHLREYVFPWCKKIVEIAHSNHKPCVLHSCGYYADIIDDIIDDMKFDARHSYEDNICPVEQAYEALNGRIAVVGGIDVNFLCQKTPEEIFKRSYDMLQRSAERGGYALGSGNSFAKYIPQENYMAMQKAIEAFNRHNA